MFVTILQILHIISILNIPNQQPTYAITVSFHPQPFYYQEWFIAVIREDKTPYILTNSPKYVRKKRQIPLDVYVSTLHRIHALGIWHCKDCYLFGDYFLLTITKGNFSHQCKIEYTRYISAQCEVYQLLRHLFHLADTYLR